MSTTCKAAARAPQFANRCVASNYSFVGVQWVEPWVVMWRGGGADSGLTPGFNLLVPRQKGRAACSGHAGLHPTGEEIRV
jgi:hypothetical protein